METSGASANSQEPSRELTASSPVTVKHVKIEGNNRMKNAFFDAHFYGIKSNVRTAQDLITETGRIRNSIAQTGIFDTVEASFDFSQKSPSDPASATIKMNVVEKGVPSLRIESNVSSGTGVKAIGAEIEGTLRSPFGYGEMAHLKSVKSSSGFQEMSFDVTMPNISAQRASFHLNASSALEDNTYFTSLKHRISSLSAELRSRDLRHTLQVKSEMRDEVPLIKSAMNSGLSAFSNSFNISSSNINDNNSNNNNSNNSISNSSNNSSDIRSKSEYSCFSSLAVLSLLKPSSKLSVKYSVNGIDSRDSAANPTKGSFASGDIELALPAIFSGPRIASTTFLRTNMSYQYHLPLMRKALNQTTNAQGPVLSCAVNTGIILPLFGSFIPLCDRYHLGGPLNLRGFHNFGVGSRSSHANTANSPTASSSSSSSSSSPSSSDGEVPSNSNSNSSSSTDSTFNPVGLSVGGLWKSSFLACLSVPLPTKLYAETNRAFIFANLGYIGGPKQSDVNAFGSDSSSSNSNSNSNSNSSTFAIVKPFLHPRLSVGAGISAAVMNVIRLELTYAIPLLSKPGDDTRNFQVGIGVSMG